MHHALTIKQAAFARELHKNGGNAAAAWRYAYDALDCQPTAISSAGSKLARRPAIKAYVADLERQAVVAAQVNKDMLIYRLLGLHDMAVEKGDLSTATRALELVGKSLPRSVWVGDRQNEKRMTAAELAKAVQESHDRLMRGIGRAQAIGKKDKKPVVH